MRTLYSAAVQLGADAVNRAVSAELQAVALALRGPEFDIILRAVGLMRLNGQALDRSIG
jgi:hypothetical protein